MGYDSRLYFVKKSDLNSIDGKKKWAEVLAIVEMCGCPAIRDLFEEQGVESNCYIFADDGNTEITVDKYDQPIREISVQAVLSCVANAMIGEDYRRYYPLAGICHGFLASHKMWGDKVVVLHYGH